LIGVEGSFDTPLTRDNAFDQLILYRNGTDVSLSIVGGTPLMQDHQLLTMDIKKVRCDAAVQASRLWEMSKRG